MKVQNSILIFISEGCMVCVFPTAEPSINNS